MSFKEAALRKIFCRPYQKMPHLLAGKGKILLISLRGLSDRIF